MMHHLLQKLIVFFFSAVLLGAAAPQAEAAAAVFLDVHSDDWFAPAVSYVTEQALFQGLSESSFAPERTMNRAMLYTVLFRMTGLEADNSVSTNLSDVPAGQWYTGAVVWAISSGIADCRSEAAFGVTEEVSRGEICLALARFNQWLEADILPEDTVASFLDLDELDDETRNAIAACQAAGIINGRSEDCFDPSSSANRAQVAQMISNFHQLLPAVTAAADGEAAVPWDTITGWTGLLHVDFPLSYLDTVTYEHVLWLNAHILAENTPASIASLGRTIDGNVRHLTNYGVLGLSDCIHVTTNLYNSKNGVGAGTSLSGRQEYYGYSLQVRGVSRQDPWHEAALASGKNTWQCTWWAWGRAAQYVELAYGLDFAALCGGRTNLGNGGNYYSSLRHYFLSDRTPSANSIVSWSGGSYGHVAYVEAVDDNGIWVSMADSGHSWRGVTYIVKTSSSTNPYPLNWYSYERLNGFNHLDYTAAGAPIG